MITMDVVLKDLTPVQAQAVAEFAATLKNGRNGDVTRVASELAAQPMPPAHPRAPTPPPSATPVPPTPPAAPASVNAAAPTTSATPATVSDAVDARGVPYDPRFYAATRGTNNDGSWKKRKGVDKDAVAAYEAQFTHRPGMTTSAADFEAAAPTASPVQAPAVTAPTSPPPPPVAAMPTAAQVTAQFAPHLASQPNGVMMPPPANELVIPTYNDFYQLYIRLCQEGRINEQTAAAIHAAAGASPTGAEYSVDENKRAIAYREMQRLEFEAAA